MEDREFYVPAGQDGPLLSNTEVVDDGLEIFSVGFGDIGSIVERLIADALTTNIIANLQEFGSGGQQFCVATVQKK